MINEGIYVNFTVFYQKYCMLNYSKPIQYRVILQQFIGPLILAMLCNACNIKLSATAVTHRYAAVNMKPDISKSDSAHINFFHCPVEIRCFTRQRFGISWQHSISYQNRETFQLGILDHQRLKLHPGNSLNVRAADLCSLREMKIDRRKFTVV